MKEIEPIYLKPLEIEDTKLIADWRNKDYIRKFFFNRSFISYSEQKIWFEKYIQDKSKEIFLAISKEKDLPIGMIGLYDIDNKNHRAELGSIIIGEESAMGRGFGQLMYYLAINYAFNSLSLNKLYAYILRTNKRSIHIFNKMKFKQEGILKKHFYEHSQYTDVVIMGLLNSSWVKHPETKLTSQESTFDEATG